MQSRPIVLGAILILACAGGAGLWTAPAQAPQPSNPQPQPSNPQPQPSNPSPQPSNPTPQPINPQPTTQPTRPGDTRQPARLDPRTPDQRRDDQRRDQDAERNRVRNLRPFAFDNPQMEGNFNQSITKLARLEERLTQSNQAMMKRLGEARRLEGDRQNAALFDIIQELLKNQNDLHQYLVQARTAWAGDAMTDAATTTTTNPR